jgi:hypothetical protein
VLGSIDIEGTITNTGDNTNKYGQTLKEYTPPGGTAYLSDSGIDLCHTNGEQLNNTVYRINGDLKIGRCDPDGPGGPALPLTTWKINNRADASTSGAGTIVVQGDLYIDVDIAYEVSQFDTINDLASLGVIVRGAVVVRGDVTSIVGSYIVLADLGFTDKTTGLEIENSLDERAFGAKGLMISPSYKFGRTFRGTLIEPKPAEEITYDGRVIANPPPGFSDFAQVLPRIREEIPF